MQKYDVDVYLAGHDHNHEHWQLKDAPDMDHVITGGGGKERYGFEEEAYIKMRELGMELLYFKDEYGFAYFVIDENTISMQFIDTHLYTLYEYSREKHFSKT